MNRSLHKGQVNTFGRWQLQTHMKFRLEGLTGFAVLSSGMSDAVSSVLLERRVLVSAMNYCTFITDSWVARNLFLYKRYGDKLRGSQGCLSQNAVQ